MKILTRYVLREFLLPLAYCLIGFISIYVLFDLFGSFSRMAAAKISVSTAIVYFCGYLAPYFHYIMPAALMLATLYTMWSFCRHSEIIAMRASGISFLAIVKPLLAVSILMALAVAYVNEVFVPAKANWAAQMKTVQFEQDAIESVDNIVFRNSRDNSTWNISTVLDDKGAHLKDVRVTLDNPETGARRLNVAAEQADYLDGEWWFTNPKVQHYDAEGQEIPTPTPELDKLKFRCFPMLLERPTDLTMQNRPWKFNSVRDRFRYINKHPELEKQDRDDCLYDTWAQIMAPFACIIITLFAIPAGIASGRQSVAKGIMGALGMYFAFYTLTIMALIVSKNGLINPILAAILPYVIFLVLGFRSFLKQR